MNNDFSLSDVCCVVVTYNGDKDVIHRIKGYSEYLDVVVVDNGSGEDFTTLLKVVESRVHIIYNEENKGIAYALNQGLRYASENDFKLLLTMDQDSEIEKDSVDNLISRIDPSHKFVSVGPFYMDESVEADQEVKYLITSGNLVLVEAAQKIGGYDTELFIDEVDLDFSYNLRKHGYRLIKAFDSKMNHKIGEYEESKILKIRYLTHSPIRFYYMFRNTIIIAKRYKQIFPKESRKLLLCLFCIDFGKIIFLENNKKTKIWNAYKGIIDGRTKVEEG